MFLPMALDMKWIPGCSTAHCSKTVRMTQMWRIHFSIQENIKNEIKNAWVKQIWVKVFSWGIFLCRVSTEIPHYLILRQSARCAERRKNLTFHTRRGRQHARPRNESLSRCPLPISNNFQHQQIITTCLPAVKQLRHSPQSQKPGNIGKEAGGEITLVAARQRIPNRADRLINVPLCLACWPASRCFPATARIVCCWETKGYIF